MKIISLLLAILCLVSVYSHANSFFFNLEEPGDTSVWDVTDYSGFKTGYQYLDTYPEETDVSNYPDFSWDKVPRWLAIRDNSPYTDYDIKAIANNYQMVMLEKANMQGMESTEAGTLSAAQRMKAVNPNIKTLFYWNSWINYGGYTANVEYDKNDWAWSNHTIDFNGNEIIYKFKDWYNTYNYSSPGLRKWWVKTALEMVKNNAIDGVFIDKVSAKDPYEGPFFIDGEPATDYIRMLDSLSQALPAGKLFFGNTLRNSRWNGNRENMRYSHGSYLEGWAGPYDGNVPAQTEADAISVSIQLMREALLKRKIINFQTDAGNSPFVTVPPESERSENNMKSFYRAAVQFPLAVFLIVADTSAYFSFQNSVTTARPDWEWNSSFIDEFHRPLGKPLGAPVRNGYIYTRSYEKVNVWVNVETKEARITWTDYPELVNLNLVVRDLTDGSGISGATIAVDKISRLTDSEGELTCALDSGSFLCTISKSGYITKEVKCNFVSDSVVYFDLPSPDPNMVFIVKDGNGQLLSDAKVSIDSRNKITNNLGEATFMLNNGSYMVTVSKSGYITKTQAYNFDINSDSTAYLKLQKSIADVEFRMKDGESIVRYATIKLNSVVQQANSLGIATYYEQSVNKICTYIVEKSGYKSVNSTFTLSNDTTINIQLNTITGLNEIEYNRYRIYPNPVSDVLIINQSNSNVAQYNIINTTGQTKLSGIVINGNNSIDLCGLSSGIYIVKIADSKQVVTKYIIKK